ncbi:hypothetical protein F8M41_002541 [Gigaspora margarita]|uniref:Uncharacterized protein n=1 Tax=Gigaspora margarita TaxID=4874 RepID=A0A8H3XDF2_GIGMA|nr:hypothetical protein F8M41_002541 [Gigaspora margarita]
MSQSTNQIISVHLQNNNGQLQRPQNFGGPRNANGRFQRTTNIGMLPIRHQNAANLFSSVFPTVQQYTDLISGADPFIRTQAPSPHNNRFSTLLFLGDSFP